MAWNLSIYLDRHVARDSISTSSAGPAKGLLARRPDLIIEAGGTFSAIEVASKAQRGNLVAARAEEGLEAALGNGEATGINSVGFTLPWSIGGVRTVGASSLPATYGIGAAGALDVGIGASRATPEAIAAYSQRIAGAWTGTFGQYTVTTQVTTPAPETPRSQYNVVDISPLAGNATNGTPFTNAVGGSYINVAPLTTGSNPVNEYNLNRADAYNLWAAGHERDMPWASRTCTATQLNVRFLATKQISWQCLKGCQKHRIYRTSCT